MGVIAAAVALLASVILGAAVLAASTLPPAATPTSTALGEIPADLLAVYTTAAATCPGLPWQVLAAIGAIESGHAQHRADPATGDVRPPILGPPLDGTNGTARIADPAAADGWARAVGPMQFLPTTWARWARLAPGRPPGASPDPHNAWDAIHTAAAYLCAGKPALADLEAAILAYNPSSAYLTAVLAKAAAYGHGATIATSGAACPVAGPVMFTNDWGAPRPGGRTHKGNDLFAPHGTALVAIESGTIGRVNNTDRGLGGLTVWLHGHSGNRYYYAHNSRNAVTTGQRVTSGEVIAYLGRTGNAATTPPHLHFEVHPPGSPAVNPFPLLVKVCPRAD
jgi:hypothetical protein